MRATSYSTRRKYPAFSGRKSDTFALESYDMRSPGPFINSGPERPSVEFKGTEAGERNEKVGFRQSAE